MFRVLRKHFCLAVTVITLVVAGNAKTLRADFFFGPLPCLSSADIPVGFYQGGSPFLLEDFADASLDASITASAGNIVFPSGATDSVDGDDGAIDGSGQGGYSWFYIDGATGISFTFSGTLPTAAAVVWTDGNGQATFEAFDENGDSIGTIGPVNVGDASFNGTTAEDRFFGATHASGISRIHISSSDGGIEVDHVQFGTAAIPEPSTVFPLMVALALFPQSRRKRHTG